MNYPKSNIVALAAALVFTTGANAQIVGKTTDTNYYNTTIIYKKGEIKDNDILSKVEKDYGMGDIIRIADAPPKPVTTPVNRAPQKLAVVESTSKHTDIKPVNTAPATLANNRQPAHQVINSPAKEEVKTAKTITAAPANVVAKSKTAGATKVTGKASPSKTTKSIKKKKSRSSRITFARPAKRQKHGKQRYGCPEF